MAIINKIRNIAPNLSAGRISLTTGDPAGVTSVTAGTTLYYGPYLGNSISLYRNGAWETVSFAEVSLAVPSVATTMHDLFGYLSNGTLALEALAWTNDSTRATALVRQNGVYCKSGDLSRRYLGSFRTVASGQTNDSPDSRLVYNYRNKLQRLLRKAFDASSWTYASNGVWRSANASTANRIDFVVGVPSDIVYLRNLMSQRLGTANVGHIGIALNATTGSDACNCSGTGSATSVNSWRIAVYNQTPPAGYNYLQATEVLSGSSGTVTFAPVVATLNVGDMQGFIYN